MVNFVKETLKNRKEIKKDLKIIKDMIKDTDLHHKQIQSMINKYRGKTKDLENVSDYLDKNIEYLKVLFAIFLASGTTLAIGGAACAGILNNTIYFPIGMATFIPALFAATITLENSNNKRELRHIIKTANEILINEETDNIEAQPQKQQETINDQGTQTYATCDDLRWFKDQISSQSDVMERVDTDERQKTNNRGNQKN